MIRLRFFGLDTCFTFGFFLGVSLLSWFHSPSVGVMAVSACVIHELGHCFMAIILNVKIIGVKFWVGGVLIKKENRIIPVSHELMILICGPAFNLIFAVFYALGGRLDEAAVNAAFALFNLLPCRTLDGGSMLCLLLERQLRCAERLQKTVCVSLGAALTLLMLATDTGSIATIGTVILLTVNEAMTS